MSKKVLICEDDIVVIKIIQIALGTEKVETIVVKDGDKAFRLLNDGNDFDLIITDIHMPHYRGDEILDLVRVKQKNIRQLL